MPNIFLVILIVSFPIFISSPCTDVVNPTSFKDCEQYVNEENETICCLVIQEKGTENQRNYLCTDMDQIFDGRNMDFDNAVLSGKLVCSSNDSSSFISGSLAFILFISGMLVI